ncbi:MAG: indole-3-glycerol phosphate synthase TrpC [Paludibacter sp.]|nr:indole-3-glycerol phosphate synthase TrpC [Paludibacter sp.]MDD4199462.1 indole-3-glycerol phosphate synthase TrpC [Paludibacter sp.]MDD4428719.1 indole-3-glycerol phosphate synthase TrpC [Paludibacter sp.]
MTILDKIIADKKTEVANRKKLVMIDDLRTTPYFSRKCISLKDRLVSSSSGIIAEFKRKSPSKGWIHEEANVVDITSGYDESGATGISVLTDSKYFGGVPEDLTAARPHVLCPILRKDFMIDVYQLFEAKAMGADVILLIAAALTVDDTLELARQAKALSLEVLLEIHNREELGHINDFVDMVGVNNRNLKTFEVNIDVSLELAALIPNKFVKISESGISSSETVNMLKAVGYQGFLMGENFMKELNPAKALYSFVDKLKK